MADSKRIFEGGIVGENLLVEGKQVEIFGLRSQI